MGLIRVQNNPRIPIKPDTFVIYQSRGIIMAKHKAKADKQPKLFKEPKSKRGRTKGQSPKEVILYNRHNCLFYITIKKGKRVVGRDYTVHESKVEQLQTKFIRAQDTLTTKLLKAVNKSTYKEDIFKAIPQFFDYETVVDLAFYPPGLFDGEDNMVSRVVDKEEALKRLDVLISETMTYLNDLGASDIAVQLASKYATMITENTPIGKTEDQNPDTVQLNQLKGFKFD